MKLPALTIKVTQYKYLTCYLVIYDIDEPVDKIYMIKSGKAIVETMIVINEENIYPTSPRDWEKRLVKKNILYKVRSLLPGEIFGHEDFINEEDPN